MSELRMVRAQAPIRRFDIGQWTDCWFAKTGCTFNFAGWPGVQVLVKEKPALKKKRTHLSYPITVEENDLSVTIHVKDMDEIVEIDHCQQVEYDGRHDLLKAAVRRVGVNCGVEITINSAVPPACGVGTSAAVGVALVGALDLFNGGMRSRREIASLAQKLEIEELKIQCGIQDQYGSALGGAWGGGIFVMHEYPDNVEIRELPLHRIPDSTFWELSSRLVLAYAGSRNSSTFHDKVISNITAGEKKSLQSLNILRKQPWRMIEALVKRDFDEIADIMMTNWRAQQNLHKEIGSPILKEIEQVALKNGGKAVKANGAGNKGSMEILCEEGYESNVRRAVNKIEGVEIIQSSLTKRGLDVWEV